ncbi:MAG: (2Fe-2S) ferredoxin domain-containing protein [Xenococcaceae cyanobacterium MO_188.B29]|nr:(2Fe-2S) ferredoxin domain-containing protein [Xenococcaceae cyanobacterium MO_188.B29]
MAESVLENQTVVKKKMTKSKSFITEFNVTGTLVDLLIKKDNQVKYIKLATQDRQYWIKVAKNIREDIAQIVSLEADLIVRGTKKQKRKTGKVKYRADYVELVANHNNSDRTIVVPEVLPLSSQDNKAKAKAKILVCKKSNCWKKGGKEVCQVLEDLSGDRQIQVKTTGCLKQCKKGPNVVILPDKARYSRVKPQQIPALVEKHL